MPYAFLPADLPLTLTDDPGGVLSPLAPPRLGLTVELRSTDGVITRWASDEPGPSNVPQGITFGTRLMHGFADFGCTLARAIDGDYHDLGLTHEITVVGSDGTVAYEGRVGATPRSFDDQHSVSVQAAGWMSHATDRRFTEVYVDRELGRWESMSRARRAVVLGANIEPADPSTASDVTSGATGLVTAINAPTLRVINEALYDAGPGRKVARVRYTLARTNLPASSGWQLAFYNGATDQPASNGSANLAGTGSVSGDYTPAAAQRFVKIYLDNGAERDSLPHEATWTALAVYGNHGLPLIGATQPYGVAASEVIKHLVGLYCPKLNARGVQATSYPIPHLVFRDRTTPYDAFLEVNKFHLWDLSCYEDRTLHYRPLDYTDYDWEIRTDEPGTTIELQGDSIENLASGIVVQYPNVQTGQTDMLTPDDYSELRDDSFDNPFNLAGYARWTEYQVSYPTTRDAALQIGRMALAEHNAPKAPGSISKSHYIRDRAGHWQPVWKVRAGDRVAVTSSVALSDRPRVIHETQYSHDSRSLTMSIEGPAPRLEAINDRVLTALAAANLS